jgi:HTH-type transcriptional regulator / antitoxin HipB
MRIELQSIAELGDRLMKERKRQGLTREQAAAVCNVSASFIRDAESEPGRCTLAKILQLSEGLGFTIEFSEPRQTASRPITKGATK